MNKINQLYTLFCVISIFCIVSQEIFAQGVAIDDQNSTEPDQTALLEIRSKTKGAVFPRMTKAQRDAVSSPVEGLLVYQIDGKQGYHYYDGSAWQQVPSQEGATPTGAIMIYAGANITNTALIQDGWHKCDGSSVSQNDPKFKDLFDVIGTNWGGSGSSFNMPDLRGMFLRGANHGRSGTYSDTDARTGGSSGDKIGSVQGDEIKQHQHGHGDLRGETSSSGEHQHKQKYTSSTNEVGKAGSGGYEVPEGYRTGTTTSAGDHQHNVPSLTGKTSNEGGDESRPNNVYVYYIIKL